MQLLAGAKIIEVGDTPKDRALFNGAQKRKWPIPQKDTVNPQNHETVDARHLPSESTLGAVDSLHNANAILNLFRPPPWPLYALRLIMPQCSPFVVAMVGTSFVVAFMSPVSPVFHTEVTVSTNIKTSWTTTTTNKLIQCRLLLSFVSQTFSCENKIGWRQISRPRVDPYSKQKWTEIGTPVVLFTHCFPTLSFVPISLCRKTLSGKQAAKSVDWTNYLNAFIDYSTNFQKKHLLLAPF